MTKKMLFGLFIISSLGCAKQEIFEKDYFIFGSYQATCQKDCTKIFKLVDEGVLYADVDVIFLEPIQFNQNAYGSSKIQRVRWLSRNIPDFLWNSSSQTIGIPNFNNEVAYYVEYYKRGEKKGKWYIDSDKSRYSNADLIRYVDSLEKITSAM